MPDIKYDPHEVEQLARYIASGGQEGFCPDWYHTLTIADRLNMSPMMLEACFARADSRIVPETVEVWVTRAVTAIKAELEANRSLAIRGKIAAI